MQFSEPQLAADPKPRGVNAWSLRTQLSMGATGLAVVATLAITFVIGTLTLERLRSDAGVAALATSLQMGEALSQGMFERYQDIRLLSSLEQMRAADQPDAAKQHLLEGLQRSMPELAWIGITDLAGHVKVATQDILEGADISKRPWFEARDNGMVVKDVHDAVLLAKLLPNPTGEPLRFVDIAAPLTDRFGTVIGVVGAHLSWHWATQVKDSLLKTRSAGAEFDLLVLSSAGMVLMGPEDLLGQQLTLESVAAAARGERGYRVDMWPDGRTYLTAYGESGAYRDFPGLGWLVLTRQPTAIAFASAREVERYIIALGAAATLALALAGWFAARRVSRPVLAIAEAADSIVLTEPGDRVQDTVPVDYTLPNVAGCHEVNVLSRSLRRLLDKLKTREVALIDLNRSLEQRIEERTQRLTAANSELTREIDLRGRLEVEREKLITELRNLADTDGLTRLHNRRSFQNLAGRELKRVQRQRGALTVMLLDIDHFKQVNDQHGHAAGDDVLRALGALLKSHLRDIDIVARHGGEEFIALLVDCAEDRGRELAERMRQIIADTDIDVGSCTLRITASFGLATASGAALQEMTLEGLVALADKALYAAKRNGRNRVEMA